MSNPSRADNSHHGLAFEDELSPPEALVPMMSENSEQQGEDASPHTPVQSTKDAAAKSATPVDSSEQSSLPVPGLFAGKMYSSRYILLERIAIGGMGEVWKARDQKTSYPIAMKILRPEFVGQDQFLSRLRLEASNAAGLNHPHLARVFDSGEEDGLGWIAMELVDGQPLTRMLKQKKTLPLHVLLPILRQTADALSAVHAGGIVHRDIKPGNILITDDNNVKLTDFSISRSQNQITLTAAGMVMGTAQYLPPEQAMGQPATPAGDLYALGVIAYEALAGRRPFTGETQVDIAFAHVNSPVPPLPESIPTPLRNLVMRLLDKKPGNRPPTAAKLSYLFSELEAELLDNKADDPTGTHTVISLSGGTVPAPPDMPISIEPEATKLRQRQKIFTKNCAALTIIPKPTYDPILSPSSTIDSDHEDLPGAAINLPAKAHPSSQPEAPQADHPQDSASAVKSGAHQTPSAHKLRGVEQVRHSSANVWRSLHARNHSGARPPESSTQHNKISLWPHDINPDQRPRHSSKDRRHELYIAFLIVIGFSVFFSILLFAVVAWASPSALSSSMSAPACPTLFTGFTQTLFIIPLLSITEDSLRLLDPMKFQMKGIYHDN